MTVLVTGGAGYIGSHMVLALTDAGEDVVVLDNLTTGFWWAVSPKARLIEGDAGDEALLARLMAEHRFDAIIHFAGSIVVPESVSDPLGYYLNNTVKSRTLMAAAVTHGVPRFIFSSTAAVYGNPASLPVFEDAAAAPISPYGTSKLMTEWMLRDAHVAHGLSYVALRYFNVAGADPEGRSGQSTPRATHLIKVACQAALGQRPRMEVFGDDYDTPDGTCIRDYIHVMDLALAHELALTKPGKPGDTRIYNCGYGTGHSVREVAAAFGKVLNHALPVRDCPRRPGDVAALACDSAKLKRELGWTPAHASLATIVETALNWERRLSAR